MAPKAPQNTDCNFAGPSPIRIAGSGSFVEAEQLYVGDDHALGRLALGHDRAQLAKVRQVQLAQAHEVALRDRKQVVREQA